MNHINTLWFYLYPYIVISEDLDNYLFYNTSTYNDLSFEKKKDNKSYCRAIARY